MLTYTNPYMLETVEEDNQQQYYISFNDGQGVFHRVEVSKEIHSAFYELGKHERNLKRWDERHIEYSELTEENLYDRARYHPKDLDTVVFEALRSEELAQAIMELPDIQNRRFQLYHLYGLTYEQIGDKEGCSKMSAKRSVDRAKGKIHEHLKGKSLQRVS